MVYKDPVQLGPLLLRSVNAKNILYYLFQLVLLYPKFSIHPPTPPELDQHGHIPMRRPPQQSHFSLSTGNSLTSLDRLPADGEEEPAEQTPTREQARGNN